jgi:predicted DNA-binding antitoxin AbrB/MazE fold protein
MTEIVTATFQDGAFVPEVQTHVPNGSRVRLVVQTIDDQETREQFLKEFDEFCDAVSVNGGKHLTRDELHDRD